MSAIWNLLNPIRCGGTNLKLMSSGRELFGTVVKSGKIEKTVTVIKLLILNIQNYDSINNYSHFFDLLETFQNSYNNDIYPATMRIVN